VGKQAITREPPRSRSGRPRQTRAALQGSGVITLAETSVLFRFTDRLYRAKQLDEVYDAALDAIIEALGCDRASLLLFDKTGVMRFVAWRGLSDSYRRAVDGHSPWKRGDRDSSPIFVLDLEGAEFPPSLKSVIAAEGIGALAFIPIMVDRLTVGKTWPTMERPMNSGSPREMLQ